MADPVVLLVAPASSGGAALQERLSSLGFRCDLVDAARAPRGWLEAAADVILVVEAGGYSSPTAFIHSRRAGTPLQDVPLLVLGNQPPVLAGDGPAVDEVIAADAGDRALAERLRVWGRWGRLASRARAMEALAAEQRATDALTGLPGYGAFQDRLNLEAKRSERYGSPLGLLLGDIEGMRGINEQYGHRTGDRVIREVGQALKRAIREVDYVARYERDRFVVLLPESNRDVTKKVMGRLRGLVSSLIFRGESSAGAPLPLLKISILFGDASLPDEKIRGSAAFLASAEEALERERAARTRPPIPA